MMDKEIILICNCMAPEHQILFRTVDNPFEPESKEEVFITYHLTKDPFWRRVKSGIKHIFGYKSRYGDFGELITTREKLKKIVEELYEN